MDKLEKIILKIFTKIKTIYYAVYDELGNRICEEYLNSNNIMEEIRSNIVLDLIIKETKIAKQKDIRLSMYWEVHQRPLQQRRKQLFKRSFQV